MAGDSDLLALMASAAVAAAEREGVCTDAAKRMVSAVYQAMRRHYGTEKVYIPALDKTARDRAILLGLAAGEPKDKIAKRVGVHPRTVSRVASRRQSMAPREWEL